MKYKTQINRMCNSSSVHVTKKRIRLLQRGRNRQNPNERLLCLLPLYPSAKWTRRCQSSAWVTRPELFVRRPEGSPTRPEVWRPEGPLDFQFENKLFPCLFSIALHKLINPFPSLLQTRFAENNQEQEKQLFAKVDESINV